MARTTCLECHMQYNLALGSCPNCGATPSPLWRRLIDRRWPLALAIGLALETLLFWHGPEQMRASAMRAVPEAAMISQFIAAALIFSVVAAFVLFAAGRTLSALRGSRRLR